MSASKNKPTSSISVLTLSIMLFFVGIYGFFLMNTSKITEIIKENIDIVVEFNDSEAEENYQSLMNELNQNEYVIPGSVEHIDKIQARELMMGDFPNGMIADGEQNPFRNSLLFNIKAAYYTDEFLEDIKSQIVARPEVNMVYFQQEFFAEFRRNLSKIGWLALGLGFLFLILAMTLIYHTVRLTLLADKKEIETMSLVGAKWSFIKKPYMLTALRVGLLSVAIALAGMSALLYMGMAALDVPFTVIALKNIFITVVILILLGVLLPYWSTSSIVNKFLREM